LIEFVKNYLVDRITMSLSKIVSSISGLDQDYKVHKSYSRRTRKWIWL